MTSAERATEALEKGIELYGRGELDAALGEWERALALDPGCSQAEEYAAYVRANYDALRAQQADAEQEQVLETDTPPPPMEDDDEDATQFASEASLSLQAQERALAHNEFVKVDSGELPMVEIDPKQGGLAAGGSTAADFELDLAGGGSLGLAGPGTMASIKAKVTDAEKQAAEAESRGSGSSLDDEDWSDLLAAPGPPKVATPAPTPFKAAPATPMQSTKTPPGPFPAAQLPASPMPSPASHLPPQRSTIAFGSAGSPILPGPGGRFPTSPGVRDALRAAEPESTILDLDDDPLDLGMTPPPPSARRADPTPSAPPHRLDEGLLAAYDDAFDEAPSPHAARSAPRGQAVIQPRPTSATQIQTLVDLARGAVARGDRTGALRAAKAAILSSREVPNGIEPRAAEALTDALLGFLGRLDQTPLVAVPLHEITRTGSLDHRTGFLLSRIDGMLTYEDILDVSGMPRLDAAQVLVDLLERGYIEVR